jgi:hypothetical protein
VDDESKTLDQWLEGQASQSISQFILETLGWSTNDLSGGVNIGFEAGADSIVDKLVTLPAATATMYTQLPQYNLEAYMVPDVSDGRLAPTTTALPLLSGDSITFVVDLDNKTGDVSVYWSPQDEINAMPNGTNGDISVSSVTPTSAETLVKQLTNGVAGAATPDDYTGKYRWNFNGLVSEGVVGNRRIAFHVKFGGLADGEKFNLKA